MKIYSAQQFFWTVFLIASGALPVSGESTDAPSPTPTPRPENSLGLRTPQLAQDLGGGRRDPDASSYRPPPWPRSPTTGRSPSAAQLPPGRTVGPTPSSPSASERARWRAAHNKQKQVITGLERRRSPPRDRDRSHRRPEPHHQNDGPPPARGGENATARGRDIRRTDRTGEDRPRRPPPRRRARLVSLKHQFAVVCERSS